MCPSRLTAVMNVSSDRVSRPPKTSLVIRLPGVCVCDRRNVSITSDSGDEREFRQSQSASEDINSNGKMKKSIFKRRSKRVSHPELFDIISSLLLPVNAASICIC